jgi:hypothetical protein
LSFPPGALGSDSTPVTVTIQQIDPSSQPPVPGGITVLAALDLSTTPASASQPFAFPVTITVPYDPATCNAACEAGLRIYVYSSGSWQLLGGVVDTANHTVSVEVMHFTQYQLVAAPASVGGIAEQPDLTALPSVASSSGHGYTVYILGAAVALIAAAGGAAGWRKRRKRA